jgi:hypothetical protein
MQKRQTISKIENLGRILGYLNNVMHVYQSSTIHHSPQVKYHIHVVLIQDIKNLGLY